MDLCWQSEVSVQLSRSVMSDSLWPHGLQHARLPCPSPTPGTCSNLCPLSQWCHPTISSSFIPFYSCLQSSQHQGLFQWISSSHQVSKVLEFQFQHQWGMQTSKFIEKVEWWVWGLGEKGMRHHYLTRTEFLFGKDDGKFWMWMVMRLYNVNVLNAAELYT